MSAFIVIANNLPDYTSPTNRHTHSSTRSDDFFFLVVDTTPFFLPPACPITLRLAAVFPLETTKDQCFTYPIPPITTAPMTLRLLHPPTLQLLLLTKRDLLRLFCSLTQRPMLTARPLTQRPMITARPLPIVISPTCPNLLQQTRPMLTARPLTQRPLLTDLNPTKPMTLNPKLQRLLPTNLFSPKLTPWKHPSPVNENSPPH